MDQLARKNKEKVIDVLCERLCFERASVKLYDKILENMRSAPDQKVAQMIGPLQEHREQEDEHARFLEGCVQELGGDVDQLTEKAALVTQESQGIEQVIMQDPQLAHLFHALMAAELVDNAGWDLLVELADEAEDRDAVREFKKRLHEEEEHLILMRQVMRNFAAAEILGEPLQIPRQP